MHGAQLHLRHDGRPPGFIYAMTAASLGTSSSSSTPAGAIASPPASAIASPSDELAGPLQWPVFASGDMVSQNEEANAKPAVVFNASEKLCDFYGPTHPGL